MADGKWLMAYDVFCHLPSALTEIERAMTASLTPLFQPNLIVTDAQLL